MLLSCVGLENLHLLTSDGEQLRIDMKDWNGNERYAQYDHFKVGPEQENYDLMSVGRYTGNAGQCSFGLIFVLIQFKF